MRSDELPITPSGAALSEAVKLWQGEHVTGPMMQARVFVEDSVEPQALPAYQTIERAMVEGNAPQILFHATECADARAFVAQYDGACWLATSTDKKSVLRTTGASSRTILQLEVHANVKRLEIAGSGLGDKQFNAENEVLLSAGLTLTLDSSRQPYSTVRARVIIT